MKKMVTQSLLGVSRWQRAAPVEKKMHTHVIDGLQFAGICDDDGDLIFGMVQQRPSNRNEKRMKREK